MVNKDRYIKITSVEALQLISGNDPGTGTAAEMATWCGGKASWDYDGELNESTATVTLVIGHNVEVKPGQWLIKQSDGAWVIMDDVEFHRSYNRNYITPKDVCSYCLGDITNTKFWDGGKVCPRCSAGYTGDSRHHEYELLEAAGGTIKQ